MRDLSVAELFARGLPVSMTLGGLALAVSLLLGTLLGGLAALRRGSALDHAVTTFGTFALTVPGFVVAPLLQIAFGLSLPGMVSTSPGRSPFGFVRWFASMIDFALTW